MASIYRKYRPKTFAEMVGQNHIKLTLEHEIKDNSFAQGYLFCGPRGLGKTTTARLLAKSLNCENRKKGEHEPCNKCNSCEAIMNNRAVDIVEIDAASHTGVDNVRENIIENARFTPNQSKYKVYIIDEVHMLSASAFNALLKTIEEPPSHVIFVLCTTEIHKVPETIISRCQRFDFKKVSAGEMTTRLTRIAGEEKVSLDDDVYAMIVRKSGGCMRDAESLLGQILSLGKKKITFDDVALVMPKSSIETILDFISILYTEDTADSIRFVNRLIEDGFDIETFVRDALEFFRILMLLKTGAYKIDYFGFGESQNKKILDIVEVVNLQDILKGLDVFLKTANNFRNNFPVAQLPLEMAVIEIGTALEKGSGGGGMQVNASLGTRKIDNTLQAKEADTEAIKKEAKEKMVNKEKEVGKNNEKQERVEEKEDAKCDSGTDEDCDKIKNNWNNIIHKAQEAGGDLLYLNASIVFPARMDDEAFVLGFKHEIHKDRFSKKENLEKMSDIIASVIDKKLKIDTVVLRPSQVVEIETELGDMESDTPMQLQSDDKTERESESDILDSLVDSFGGQMVE